MPTARSSSAWRRRITNALTQRLLLKGTALLVAVVLWFIVSAKEPTEALVPVRFAPALDGSLALHDAPPQIRALVIGRGGELLKLYSSPPVIRRPVAADAPDTLIMDLRATDVEVPAGIDAIVRDVQPRSVTLRFEPTSSRMVPVRSAISVGTAPLPAPVAIRFEPESVEVTGPRRAVLKLPGVRTARTTLWSLDSIPHLVDLDTSRLNVRVRPSQVRVYVSLVPIRPKS
jgi:hypothetical protein